MCAQGAECSVRWIRSRSCASSPCTCSLRRSPSFFSLLSTTSTTCSATSKSYLRPIITFSEVLPSFYNRVWLCECTASSRTLGGHAGKYTMDTGHKVNLSGIERALVLVIAVFSEFFSWYNACLLQHPAGAPRLDVRGSGEADEGRGGV